jgi:DNA-binding transcriptional LysR family regulator
VVTTPANIPQNMKSTTLKNFKEIPICGSSFSQLTKRKLSLKDISNFSLICLAEHTMTYHFYEDLFLKQGLTFSPQVQAATISQIIPLVKNNLGIGFIPEPFLHDPFVTDFIYTMELDPPIPIRDICLVKRKGTALTIAAKKLEEMILSQV